MRTILIALFVGLISGFGIAWNWQGQRWDADVAELRQEQSNKLIEAWAEGQRKASAVEDQKEVVQNEFEAFKKSESERNIAINSGVKRVYVRAACPSVPSTSSNAGGVTSGTAELDPAYRQTLSDLRSSAAEQLKLLNVCRAELSGRSSSQDSK